MRRTFRPGHQNPSEYPVHGGVTSANLINPHEMLWTGENTGIPFGIDEQGNQFFFDIGRWQEEDRIGSTIIFFYGEKGSGKTAGGMIMAGRYHPLRAGRGESTNPFHRVGAIDTRRNAGNPEYAGFAEFLSDNAYGATDASQFKINPLDSYMGLDIPAQKRITSSLGGAAINRLYTPDERYGLEAVLRKQMRMAPDDISMPQVGSEADKIRGSEIEEFVKFNRRVAIKGLEEALAKRREAYADMDVRNASPEEVRRMQQTEELIERRRAQLDESGNLNVKNVLRGAGDVAQSIDLLMSDHGDIFAGQTGSLYNLLNREAVVLDFANINENTKPLLEMLMWNWRNAAINNHDRNLMTHFELHDENWLDWQSPVYAENMLARVKRIRGAGTILAFMTHRPADSESLPPAQASALESVQRAADVRIIGRSERSDVQEILRYVPNMPEKYIKQIPNFKPGEYIICIGQETPFKIYLTPTEEEFAFIETNQAATDNSYSWERVNPDMDPEARKVASNWGY